MKIINILTITFNLEILSSHQKKYYYLNLFMFLILYNVSISRTMTFKSNKMSMSNFS